MKEFAVSEPARIRLKAMIYPIFLAVALKQLEYSIDPFPIVEFMLADLFTAPYTAFSFVAVIISTAQYCKCYLIKNFKLLKISCLLRSFGTADVKCILQMLPD